MDIGYNMSNILLLLFLRIQSNVAYAPPSKLVLMPLLLSINYPVPYVLILCIIKS